MINTQIYDELRPYNDSEVEAAVKEMVTDPMLFWVLRPVFPTLSDSEITRLVASQRTIDAFQREVAIPMVQWVIDNTMTSFSWSGLENIERRQGHLYISNHRDIVLDGALLQYVFLAEGMPTSEVTFGDNLLYNKLVEHLARLNKLFKIRRVNSGREFLDMSRILSEHLNDVVSAGRSIWIAQRNGRTKDGNDKTEQALIKMVAMSGSDTKKALQSLNIQPFAISYELESCDILKARETYLRRRGNYKKAEGEDFNSIIGGIKQPKGRVHIAFAPAIRREEIEAIEGTKTEIIDAVSALLDERIRSAFRLFPNNYIAADMLSRGVLNTPNYTSEQREWFEAYMEHQLSTLEPSLDRTELRQIFLEIYANPVFAVDK